MAASEVLSFLALAAYAVIGIKMLRSSRPEEESEPEPEEDPTEFEFLTVREQLAAATGISDKIAEMEQLQTDLVESTPEDLLCVHMEWVGHDSKQHAYDLLCNGADTASESLTAAAERESYMLRQVLSKQCAVLGKAEHRSQNGSQNDAKGGEWVDQAVRSMRRSDLIG